MSPLSTSLVLSLTPSRGTTTTLATWWKRTPAWKTVRGYWARDRWSGKMVWHTYTTGSSSSSTLFQPTTSSGFKTLVVTSAPLIQTSVQTMSSKTVPATSKITKQTFEETSTTRGQGDGEGQGEWRRDSHGKWIWYPSFDTTVTTKDQVDVHTSSWPVSSTTPTTASPTSIGTPQSTTTETLSTTVLRRVDASTQRTSVRDQTREDASNRTNRTLTTGNKTNILSGPSTITPLSESTAAKSSTIFNDVTPTTERPRPSTTDNSDGYWLVDEAGKKLTYVRPSATGHHADAWRQFIGAATPTRAPVRRPKPGHRVRSS